MVLVGRVGDTVIRPLYRRLTPAEFSIGPILIGMLKATIDTVSATTGRRALEERGVGNPVSGAVT